jgi:carbon monoxide dehydrogenase subunit G
MSEIHKSATVEASVERVFDFVDEPQNLSTYVPNVDRVEDVHRTEQRIGDSFRVVYKVLGITFDEKFTVAEYERPQQTVLTFEGGMKGRFAWTFEAEGPHTRVDVDVEYELAGGPLGKAVDLLLLERTNERTIDQMFQNMRRELTEATSAP